MIKLKLKDDFIKSLSNCNCKDENINYIDCRLQGKTIKVNICDNCLRYSIEEYFICIYNYSYCDCYSIHIYNECNDNIRNEYINDCVNGLYKDIISDNYYFKR